MSALDINEVPVQQIHDMIRSVDETMVETGPIRPLVDKRAELQAELDRRGSCGS